MPESAIRGDEPNAILPLDEIGAALTAAQRESFCIIISPPEAGYFSLFKNVNIDTGSLSPYRGNYRYICSTKTAQNQEPYQNTAALPAVLFLQ
jgi:hypothetical protein